MENQQSSILECASQEIIMNSAPNHSRPVNNSVYYEEAQPYEEAPKEIKPSTEEKIQRNNYSSAVEIRDESTTFIDLPPICWHGYTCVPKFLNLINTGPTILINGQWQNGRPYINGGPLNGTYMFSQIHFHSPSEHELDGKRYPLEMHAVHYKTSYLTQERAMKEKDGTVVLVYLFQITDAETALSAITKLLPQVSKEESSVETKEIILNRILKPFSANYYVYWGRLAAEKNSFVLQWIINRNILEVSKQEVQDLATILKPENNTGKPRMLPENNTVYHVGEDEFYNASPEEAETAGTSEQPSPEALNLPPCPSCSNKQTDRIIREEDSPHEMMLCITRKVRGRRGCMGSYPLSWWKSVYAKSSERVKKKKKCSKTSLQETERNKIKQDEITLDCIRLPEEDALKNLSSDELYNTTGGSYSEVQIQQDPVSLTPYSQPRDLSVEHISSSCRMRSPQPCVSQHLYSSPDVPYCAPTSSPSPRSQSPYTLPASSSYNVSPTTPCTPPPLPPPNPPHPTRRKPSPSPCVENATVESTKSSTHYVKHTPPGSRPQTPPSTKSPTLNSQAPIPPRRKPPAPKPSDSPSPPPPPPPPPPPTSESAEVSPAFRSEPPPPPPQPPPPTPAPGPVRFAKPSPSTSANQLPLSSVKPSPSTSAQPPEGHEPPPPLPPSDSASELSKQKSKKKGKSLKCMKDKKKKDHDPKPPKEKKKKKQKSDSESENSKNKDPDSDGEKKKRVRKSDSESENSKHKEFDTEVEEYFEEIDTKHHHKSKSKDKEKAKEKEKSKEKSKEKAKAKKKEKEKKKKKSKLASDDEDSDLECYEYHEVKAPKEKKKHKKKKTSSDSDSEEASDSECECYEELICEPAGEYPAEYSAPLPDPRATQYANRTADQCSNYYPNQYPEEYPNQYPNQYVITQPETCEMLVKDPCQTISGHISRQQSNKHVKFQKSESQNLECKDDITTIFEKKRSRVNHETHVDCSEFRPQDPAVNFLFSPSFVLDNPSGVCNSRRSPSPESDGLENCFDVLNLPMNNHTLSKVEKSVVKTKGPKKQYFLQLEQVFCSNEKGDFTTCNRQEYNLAVTFNKTLLQEYNGIFHPSKLQVGGYEKVDLIPKYPDPEKLSIRVQDCFVKMESIDQLYLRTNFIVEDLSVLNSPQFTENYTLGNLGKSEKGVFNAETQCGIQDFDTLNYDDIHELQITGCSESEVLANKYMKTINAKFSEMITEKCLEILQDFRHTKRSFSEISADKNLEGFLPRNPEIRFAKNVGIVTKNSGLLSKGYLESIRDFGVATDEEGEEIRKKSIQKLKDDVSKRVREKLSESERQKLWENLKEKHSDSQRERFSENFKEKHSENSTRKHSESVKEKTFKSLREIYSKTNHRRNLSEKNFTERYLRNVKETSSEDGSAKSSECMKQKNLENLLKEEKTLEGEKIAPRKLKLKRSHILKPGYLKSQNCDTNAHDASEAQPKERRIDDRAETVENQQKGFRTPREIESMKHRERRVEDKVEIADNQQSGFRPSREVEGTKHRERRAEDKVEYVENPQVGLKLPKETETLKRGRKMWPESSEHPSKNDRTVFRRTESRNNSQDLSLKSSQQKSLYFTYDKIEKDENSGKKIFVGSFRTKEEMEELTKAKKLIQSIELCDSLHKPIGGNSETKKVFLVSNKSSALEDLKMCENSREREVKTQSKRSTDDGKDLVVLHKYKPKHEAKPEPKHEAKPEPKNESKAEPKNEPKAEPKNEPKAETKNEQKMVIGKTVSELHKDSQNFKRLADIIGVDKSKKAKISVYELEKPQEPSEQRCCYWEEEDSKSLFSQSTRSFDSIRAGKVKEARVEIQLPEGVESPKRESHTALIIIPVDVESLSKIEVILVEHSENVKKRQAKDDLIGFNHF